MTQPSSLIINSPYEAPRQHWQQARDGSLTLTPERRRAGYEIFDARHNTRRTETLDLVNSIRGRVVTEQNCERLEPVFDEDAPIGSTASMRTWYTTKTCHPTGRSQISHMVADSSWEQFTANLLEMSKLVTAYVKNDHLGFQVYYLWNGSRRRFIPDFIIRLNNGKMLVLEIKGEDSEQNKAKRVALDFWVQGVNAKGGFGAWCCDVAFVPAQLQDILHKHGA